MGKFSGINADSLYSLADWALDEIYNGKIEDVIYDFDDFRILESPAGQNAVIALNNILDSKSISGSIINLKEKLNNLLDASDAIAEYQELEKEIDYLEDNLYYTDYEYDYYTEEWEQVTKTDWDVYYEIQDDKSKLKKLENKISNLLS